VPPTTSANSGAGEGEPVNKTDLEDVIVRAIVAVIAIAAVVAFLILVVRHA
jgi:hypothetical protein